jgi:hypothetical protein
VIGSPEGGDRPREVIEEAVDAMLDEFQLAGERAIATTTIRDLVEAAAATSERDCEGPAPEEAGQVVLP